MQLAALALLNQGGMMGSSPSSMKNLALQFLIGMSSYVILPKR
jgi:hypothetical protein